MTTTEGERLAKVEQQVDDLCKKVCNGDDSLVRRCMRIEGKVDKLAIDVAGVRVRVAVLWGVAALAGSAVGAALSQLVFK